MLIVNALGWLDNPNLALARPQSDNPVAITAIELDARTLTSARLRPHRGQHHARLCRRAEDPYAYTLKTIAIWDGVLAPIRAIF